MTKEDAIELIKEQYVDEYGCIVCKDAMTGGQAGREDSAHKAAFYNFYLRRHSDFRFFWTNNINPVNYYIDKGLIRHPLTQYCTSRDQILPFMIMLNCIVTDCFLTLDLKNQIKYCKVEKKEYRKYERIIKLFYHCPNGDIILSPNHLSCLSRIFGTKWYYLTDIFMPIIVLATYFKKNDKHLISQIMQLDYCDKKKPTIFSKLAKFLFNFRHDRCTISDAYFEGENNPPINILMR